MTLSLGKVHYQVSILAVFGPLNVFETQDYMVLHFRDHQFQAITRLVRKRPTTPMYAIGVNGYET